MLNAVMDTLYQSQNINIMRISQSIDGCNVRYSKSEQEESEVVINSGLMLFRVFPHKIIFKLNITLFDGYMELGENLRNILMNHFYIECYEIISFKAHGLWRLRCKTRK